LGRLSVGIYDAQDHLEQLKVRVAEKLLGSEVSKSFGD
jgi:hypothetical protein